MKLLQLLDNVLSIVESIVGTVLALLTYSFVTTGDVFQIFQEIPTCAWYICIAIIIIWLIIIIINNRRKNAKRQYHGVPFVGFAMSYNDEWIDIEDINYKDVIWKVKMLKRGRSTGLHDNDINVDIPPRCQKCGTKLEQSRTYFDKFIWKCVSCGFSKKNDDSWYVERDRVEKITQREVEKSLPFE
jgi:ribosomal protein L37AE/L43A